MPLVERSRRLGFKHFGMPPLTQTLGPWLQPVEGSTYRQISKIHDYTNELIEQIPAFDYFQQNANYELEDVLPFHWKGFENQIRYTYVLDDLSSLTQVWDGLAGRPRRAIRKAQRKVGVHETQDVDLFIELYKKTFLRQGLDTPVNEQTIHRVFEAALRHNAAKILVAEDGAGTVHAGVFLLYDHRSTYYLMGGTDPTKRDSQALSLLLWEAIQFASTVSQRFDFEGSMIKSVEGFFRSFGATRKSYYSISKKSLRFQLAWQARSIVRTISRRD